MAQNLAVTTTLYLMVARVREAIGAVSEQASGIINADIIDVIHNAVLLTRKSLGVVLDDFYKLPVTAISLSGTMPNYSASIATMDIAQMDSRTLYSSTLGGQIPIYSADEFDQIKTLYDSSEIGDNAIATIAQASGTLASLPTASAVTIRVYSGYASAATDLQLTVIRSPRYVTVGTDTLDIPDMYADLVEGKAIEILKSRSK